MKLIASLLSAAAVLTSMTVAATAAAQQAGQHAPTTTKTADYTEQSFGGDQVVKFTGDELVGPAGGAYGDVIRRPPGVTRVGLIRPRMNFVSELLKCVENI